MLARRQGMRVACSPNSSVSLLLVKIILFRKDETNDTDTDEDKEEVEQNIRDHEPLLIQWNLCKEESELDTAVRSNSTDSPNPEPQLKNRYPNHERKVHQLENPAGARARISTWVHSGFTPSKSLPKVQWHNLQVTAES